jgi:hypothetical protein
MGNAKQGLTKEEAFENEKSFIKRKWKKLKTVDKRSKYHNESVHQKKGK